VEVASIKDFDEGAAVAKIRTRLAGYKTPKRVIVVEEIRVTGWENF
jgi:hypothetical protein